jgi:hypothetical protein
VTGWRKVCDVEQGGGPVRPGEYEGRSGVGVVISSQQGFLVEERKKFRHRPQTSAFGKATPYLRRVKACVLSPGEYHPRFLFRQCCSHILPLHFSI